jgi:hypothetical protein
MQHSSSDSQQKDIADNTATVRVLLYDSLKLVTKCQ